MDTASLKPCPFCGSVKELHTGIKSGKVIWNMLDTRKLTYRRYYVRCHKCNARGPVVSGFVCDIIAGQRIAEQMTVVVDGVDTVINTDEHYLILAWKKWNDTFSEDEQLAFCGDLESVQPAFWVVSSDGFITCSACGEENGETSSFCPHCGRPMDGGAT